MKRKNFKKISMLEPYAMKVARTVLSGGKVERPYLSQPQDLAKTHQISMYKV